MCGICGIVRKDARPVDRDALGRMCRTMVHRGPDEDGFYWGDGVGLGMRRLKIIDLETGRQPIRNEDGTVWVVFNGEIYNYRELRTDLEARGHRFSTRSDTEVLVHLYEEIGEDTPTRLNGMFCFAVWDVRRRRLFLARDRLGIKPLYFFEDAGLFVFGSEIKAVLAHPAVPRRLDPEAVRDYFSFLYVPSPRTIYRDIRQQDPATWTALDREGTRSGRYWSLAYQTRIRDEAEAVEQTVERLRDSVRYRLISDVPLGAYLSGGIDSGIIVALMAELSSKPVETFTIVWGEEGAVFDEREHAREVARRHGANHHEIPVSPDVSGVLDDIIASFDAPFADASAIPNYYLAEATRRSVTVALSGLGGDEMAAGYERYLGMRMAESYNRLPRRLRRGLIEPLVRRLPDSRSGRHHANRLKRFVAGSELPFLDRYYHIVSTFSDEEKARLFSPALRQEAGRSSSRTLFQEIDASASIGDDLNRLLHLDLRTYLVDDLLTLSDRMSMRHSLELRVPFLDYRLVEHFASLDPGLKLRFRTKKYILKKIAERYLPRPVIHRPKMGFSVPLVVWFRSRLRPFLEECLNHRSIELCGLFDAGEIDRYVAEHLERRANHDERLWSLIVFLRWYHHFIDRIY